MTVGLKGVTHYLVRKIFWLVLITKPISKDWQLSASVAINSNVLYKPKYFFKYRVSKILQGTQGFLSRAIFSFDPQSTLKPFTGNDEVPSNRFHKCKSDEFICLVEKFAIESKQVFVRSQFPSKLGKFSAIFKHDKLFGGQFF